MTMTQRIRLYAWRVYHLAFEEYFLVLSRKQQLVLIAVFIGGCIADCLFAQDVGFGLAVMLAAMLTLAVGAFGIFAYCGYWIRWRALNPVREEGPAGLLFLLAVHLVKREEAGQ